MPTPPARPNQPLTSRYGSIGQGAEWHEAIEAYYWDRLPESFEIAQGLGAGFGGAALNWYRMIEGEALTRERAVIEDVESWLSLEFDPSEVDLEEPHRQAIVDACSTVASRLGWNFEMPVRATVLLAEVDAPWHGARYGYCIDKYPYDKICVPHRSAKNPSRLASVIAHEFTHVITLNLTQARIPHWLDEGLAMLMEDANPPVHHPWMSAIELEASFEADRRDHEGLSRAETAYDQAATIVRHLHSLGGDAKLAALLRAFTNNGLWAEVRINVFGEPSVEEALHEVYGIGQRELFEAARARV